MATAVIKPFLHAYDSNNRYPGIGFGYPTWVDARYLAANTAERHTIPSGAKKVFFSGTGTFWAKFGNNSVTAAIPATDVTDGSAPELNPTLRSIDDAGYISLIAPTADTIVQMAFFT